MKDQKNAKQLAEKSLKLAIELLKSLKEYNALIPTTKVTPIKDAEDNVHTAALLIACELINTDKIEEAEKHIQNMLTLN